MTREEKIEIIADGEDEDAVIKRALELMKDLGISG